MPKNIVVCCDGTGNQVDGNLSNVLKLFRVAAQNDEQRVFYTPGVGTIANRDAWQQLKQNAWGIFGLATGWGLDDEILAAYRFICATYEKDDDIFLFGFSRGAYSVRAVAGLMRMIGLLRPDQMNVAGYGLNAYKQAAYDNKFDVAWQFGRVMAGRHVTIKFMGVFDTVASVIVPRIKGIVPFLQTLPYTATNDSIQIFRQAMAIDERRRMFRLNEWTSPQPFHAKAFDKNETAAQDVRQVWFAGVHSDVGGGYPEKGSGLSKFPLAWMIAEAKAHGLAVNDNLVAHLVFGAPVSGSRQVYEPPNAAATLHDSMTPGWRALEFIPRSMKLNEWPRSHLLGLYIPNSEPRKIADDHIKPRIHQSVLDRRNQVPDYRPINFPADYDVEPWVPPIVNPAEVTFSPPKVTG